MSQAPASIAVLLHGILRSKRDMAPMAHYLKSRGYTPINIFYPSRKKSLESLTEFVHKKITENPAYSPDAEINFVTHSMGGLVARYYIAQHRPKQLGKVVMLSPPNTGSDFADFLTKSRYFSKLYKIIFGPAGQQLTTFYKHPYTTIDFPLGIIAGTRSINPLSPFILPRKKVGDHDGIVPVKCTNIDGMRDHITIPENHTFMMFKKTTMQQTGHFLKHNCFKRKSKT